MVPATSSGPVFGLNYKQTHTPHGAVDGGDLQLSSRKEKNHLSALLHTCDHPAQATLENYNLSGMRHH